MTQEEKCPKLDTCPKVSMVLDKDLSFDELCRQAIEKVCRRCEEK